MRKIVKGIGLKELIRSIHTELVESQADREQTGMPPLFSVNGLDLEMHFTVSETGHTGGKIDLKIISVGSDHTIKEEQIHRITLHLRALDPEPYPRPTSVVGNLPKKLQT